MAQILRSPNEMLAKGKELMLDGKEPENKHDWLLLMNFFAANIVPECGVAACKLFRTIYQMPVTDREIELICEFQHKRMTQN